MSKIFAIAKITSNKNMIGLRIADVEEKKPQCKDVPVASMKKVLASGGIIIENLGLVEGELVGTNGSIDRLADVDSSKGLIGKSPLVIVNKLGDAGFTVVDYKGNIKKATNTDVVKYAKLFGIANGKVIVKDNLEYISSINGEYETKEIAVSKLGGNKELTVGLTLNRDNRSVAQHTKVEVQDELNNRDVFNSMSPQQKKAVQDYYMWYTVNIYEGMSKGMRFSLKQSSRGVAKAEAISQLRGEDDWEFAGIKDCGFQGASKCQLGHSLRYEYYAVAKDEQGEIIDSIIFGETCAGDFFDITKEDMAKLVKTRMMMTDEIKIITDIAANNREKEEWHNLKLIIDTLKVLSSRENSKAVIYKIFGQKVGNTVANFLNVNIPFPESLVLLLKDKIWDFGTANFWKEVFPQQASMVGKMFSKGDYYSFKGVCALYLTYMAQVKMGCQFGYDPTQYERDKKTWSEKNLKVGKNDTLGKQFGYAKPATGGFSKKDSQTRRSILSRLRGYTKCKDYSIEEAEGLLKLAENYDAGVRIAQDCKNRAFEDCGINIITKMRDVTEENEMLDLAYMLLENNDRISFERSYRTRGKYNNYSINELAQFIGKAQTQEFANEIDNLIAIEAAAKRAKEKEEAELAKRLADEKERKEQEEKKKAEEDAKNKVADAKADENLTELKELIDKHPEVVDNYATKISKDILNRNVPYDKLSYKQKNIVKQATAIYKAADGQEVPAEDINESHTLDEKPDIKEEVESVLAYKDDKEIADKIKAVLPKVFDIAESVKKRNEVSDKQYKHIKAAYNLIKVLAE